MNFKIVLAVLPLLVAGSVWACPNYSGLYHLSSMGASGVLTLEQQGCSEVIGTWELGGDGFQRTLDDNWSKVDLAPTLVVLKKWNWVENEIHGEETTQDLLTHRDLYTNMYQWKLNSKSQIEEVLKIFNGHGKLLSTENSLYDRVH